MITNKYTLQQLTIMSEDIVKTSTNELVGVRLSPQIIEKIDERVALYGGNRQDVIKQALKNDLFQGC